MRVRKKIPNTSRFVKKSDYNAKISELENKMLNISGLVTTSVLIAVENKIPSISNFVKKTDYDTNFSELAKKLLIISMTNILLLQNLIS